MSHKFILIVDGNTYAKGKEPALQSIVERYRFQNTLILEEELAKRLKFKDKNSQKRKQKKQFNMQWDWDKIPVDMFPKIREYIETLQYGSLLFIHNELELSGNNYCCGDAVTGTMYNEFKWEYNKGRFNDPEYDV
jgi:hypothetical protein